MHVILIINIHTCRYNVASLVTDNAEFHQVICPIFPILIFNVCSECSMHVLPHIMCTCTELSLFIPSCILVKVNPSLVNPRRACAAWVTVVVLCVCLSVCLSTTILGLQATRRLLSDTNIFSATRVSTIMWRFC